jgi:hypothetical protein
VQRSRQVAAGSAAVEQAGCEHLGSSGNSCAQVVTTGKLSQVNKFTELPNKSLKYDII